jgi:hypothetical protein
MQLPELIVGTVGLIGTTMSIVTVHGFRLRHWKEPMYYFIGGLLILTCYQFLSGFEIVLSPVLRGTVETGFAATITLGIYKMLQTAKTVGA